MDNKKFVQEYCKRLWEKRDLTVIDEFFAADAKIRSPFGLKQGREEMREIAEKWLTAFPDLLIKWQDWIAEGDKVVARWQATGTHLGSFFETSPTHTEISYSGVHIYTTKNNIITEYWSLVDVHAILAQLDGYEHIAEAIE